MNLFKIIVILLMIITQSNSFERNEESFSTDLEKQQILILEVPDHSQGDEHNVPKSKEDFLSYLPFDILRQICAHDGVHKSLYGTNRILSQIVCKTNSRLITVLKTAMDVRTYFDHFNIIKPASLYLQVFWYEDDFGLNHLFRLAQIHPNLSHLELNFSPLLHHLFDFYLKKMNLSYHYLQGKNYRFKEPIPFLSLESIPLFLASALGEELEYFNLSGLTKNSIRSLSLFNYIDYGHSNLQWPHLLSLNLHSCYLKNIRLFQNLDSLRELKISNCAVKKQTPLSFPFLQPPQGDLLIKQFNALNSARFNILDIRKNEHSLESKIVEYLAEMNLAQPSKILPIRKFKKGPHVGRQLFSDEQPEALLSLDNFIQALKEEQCDYQVVLSNLYFSRDYKFDLEELGFLPKLVHLELQSSNFINLSPLLIQNPHIKNFIWVAKNLKEQDQNGAYSKNYMPSNIGGANPTFLISPFFKESSTPIDSRNYYRWGKRANTSWMSILLGSKLMGSNNITTQLLQRLSCHMSLYFYAETLEQIVSPLLFSPLMQYKNLQIIIMQTQELGDNPKVKEFSENLQCSYGDRIKFD